MEQPSLSSTGGLHRVTDSIPERPNEERLNAAIATAQILEALASASRDQEPALIEALTIRLQDDAAVLLLEARHRSVLCRHMEYHPPQRDFNEYLPRYVRFVVAALDVLRNLGEPDTMPTVLRLAKSHVDPRIADKAADVLSFLRGRTQLVRPAGAGPIEPADHLVRPSDPDA